MKEIEEEIHNDNYYVHYNTIILFYIYYLINRNVLIN